MITEDELVERDWISKEEIQGLMDHFNVPHITISEWLGLTYSTWQVYWTREEGIPESHYQTLILKFLKLFELKDKQENGTPTNEEIMAETKNQTQQQKDTDPKKRRRGPWL